MAAVGWSGRGRWPGIAFRVFWVGAPRWLYTPCYIAMGWAAVFFLPDFMRTGGIAVLVLVIVGGLLYSAGGVIYGLKRPNPSPRWFGFHEVFHSLTLAAFVVHYVGHLAGGLPARMIRSRSAPDRPLPVAAVRSRGHFCMPGTRHAPPP